MVADTCPQHAFDPAGPGFPIVETVEPVKGECIVTKTLPNAFAGTGLKGLIKDHAVKSIIVAGFMTHMCVSSTVRAALYMAALVGTRHNSVLRDFYARVLREGGYESTGLIRRPTKTRG